MAFYGYPQLLFQTALCEPGSKTGVNGPNARGKKTQTLMQLYNFADLENKMHELLFRHFKQLEQTEPSEPLITGIYKPENTLM